MFWMRNKENNFPIRTLIWSPELVVYDCLYVLITACYTPPEYPDAFIETSLGEFLNSVVTFKCIKGYLLRGNPSVVCQGNGMWSKRDFTCNGEC